MEADGLQGGNADFQHQLRSLEHPQQYVGQQLEHRHPRQHDARLIGLQTTATAVLGVYFKLQSFVFMPVFGLNNGMVPIVAYNFGANKPERMLKTVKLGICYATCIMLAGVAVLRS